MNKARNKQGGAVLIVALLFLLLLTLVAATGAETSTMQLQMAGNVQSRVEAQQQVLAVLDAIIDDDDNAPIVGNIGYKICEQGSNDSSCDLQLISLPSAVTTIPSGVSMDYFVTRVGPLEVDAPPMYEEQASSASAYKMARQEITASFDGDAARLGRSTIVQGVQVRIPAQNN
ncbi:MAG: PilX N-terminal domain-containing pilus assembly protein [Halieaceae bacterium]